MLEKIKEFALKILRKLPEGETITITAWVAAICAEDKRLEGNNVRSVVGGFLPPVSYFHIPILRTLQEMGGAGQKGDVIRHIVEADIRSGKYTERHLDVVSQFNSSIIEDHIAWARSNLVNTGRMVPAHSGHPRGLWALTDKGQQINLQSIDAAEFNREVHRGALRPLTKGPAEAPLQGQGAETQSDDDPDTPPEEDQLGKKLLNRVRNLPPFGFERFCRRLLTAIGFQQVENTGKTNDKGFDGSGTLVMNSNPFVVTSFIFECKRWGETRVGPDVVRALRGKIGEGIAEKGAVITTSRFTRDAQEAAKKGVVIGLVGGEEIVELMQKHLLGVKRVETKDADETKEEFVIDESFFAQYEKESS